MLNIKFAVAETVNGCEATPGDYEVYTRTTEDGAWELRGWVSNVGSRSARWSFLPVDHTPFTAWGPRRATREQAFMAAAL
jgi:hypothetical protein